MKVNMKKQINAVLSLLFLALLSAGCTPRPAPAPFIYTLENQSSGVAAQAGLATQKPVLKLMPVRAAGPFTVEDMVYRDNHYGLNSYAHSRWSDAPARMLEVFFLASLGNSGLFTAVLPPSSAAGGDLILESVLQDFSAHIDSGSGAEAGIRMFFYLIETHSRSLLASKVISVSVPAADSDARHAAAALNAAAAKVAKELQKWLSMETAALHKRTQKDI